MAGTPNANAPGLAGFKINDPFSYDQFELGNTVLSVAVQPARLLFDSSIKPAPPAVDVNKNDITVWLDRFIKGSSPHFFRAVLQK